MSEWTKEPWLLSNYDNAAIHGLDKIGICDLRHKDGHRRRNSEANAQRIVACVNAMTGIDDPAGFIKQIKYTLQNIEEVSSRATLNRIHTKFAYDLSRKALALFPSEEDKGNE